MFICVAKTSIEWSKFIQAARQATGKNATESIDKEGWPHVGIPTYLCAVAEFAKPGGDAWTQLREDIASKKHAMFSFLVNLPREEFVMLASFGLSVTPADVGDVALITGRLSDWVQAVVEASNTKSLRKFACCLLAWFEGENLGIAWESWDRDHIAQEKLFKLVRK